MLRLIEFRSRGVFLTLVVTYMVCGNGMRVNFEVTSVHARVEFLHVACTVRLEIIVYCVYIGMVGCTCYHKLPSVKYHYSYNCQYKPKYVASIKLSFHYCTV